MQPSSADRASGPFHRPVSRRRASSASSAAADVVCRAEARENGREPKGSGSRSGPSREAVATALALVAILGLPISSRCASAAEASAWAKGAHSEARLIEGDPDPVPAGTLQAGLEVRLDPAFITYWRDPGDAGVPPVFDFAGSTNLKSAEVRYPAPAGLDEAGIVAFGYTGDVTFPIEAVPADPTKPVGLHVDLAYAVCHDICLPARAALRIDLDGHPSAEASRVDEALAKVPRPARLGESVGALAILRAEAVAGGDGSVEAEAPPGSTLFVEAPEAFAFAAGAPSPVSDGRLVFPVKRLSGSETAPPPPLTLTLVAPGDPPAAIEVHTQLDAAAKTP